MSVAYVRDTYGVPAKRGRFVEIYFPRLVEGRRAWRLAASGRISSVPGAHLRLNGLPGEYHPTYGVVYYADDGETVLLDTREDRP